MSRGFPTLGGTPAVHPPPRFVTARPAVPFDGIITVPDVGWTDFVLHHDARAIYADGTGGDDTYDGFFPAFTSGSHGPKKTLAEAVPLLRAGYGDWLCLKRGTSFSETLGSTAVPGLSAGYPTRLCAYGPVATARPIIEIPASGSSLVIGWQMTATTTPVRFLAITGIDWTCSGYDGTEGPLYLQFVGAIEDLLIEDCRFTGAWGGLTVVYDHAAGVEYRPTRITVRRCVFAEMNGTTSSNATGIYVDGVDNFLVAVCAFDRIGYTDPTVNDHAIYVQSNCGPATVSDNIFARCQLAVEMRSGGAFVRNLCLDNSQAISIDDHNNTGNPDPGPPLVAQNVILDSHDVVVGAMNPDDNHPLGIAIQTGGTRAGSAFNILDNIMSLRTTAADNNCDAIAFQGVQAAVDIGFNIIEGWGNALSGGANGSGMFVGGQPVPYGISFHDNDVQQTLALCVNHRRSDIAVVYARNRYYSTASPPFYFGATGDYFKTFAQFVAATGDTTSTWEHVTYTAPGLTIGNYMTSHNGTATLAGFMAKAREYRRGAEQQGFYTAKPVINFRRAGNDKPPI